MKLKVMGRKIRFGIFAALFAVLLPAAPKIPVQAEVKAEDSAAEYLLPEADSRYYTEDEIEDMPLQILCYARNEIYARHNRKFNSTELQEYFDSQWWYKGTVSPEEFPEGLLNEYEKANAKLLYEKEYSLKDGGYTLDVPGYDIKAAEEYLGSSESAFNITSGLTADVGLQVSVLRTDYFMIEMPGTQSDAVWGCVGVTDTCLSIFCQAVWDAVGSSNGEVMYISAYDWGDNSYTDIPGWRIAGKSADKKYIAWFPTDLRYDPDDSEQAEEYQELRDWLENCDESSENNIFSVINP